jgi:rubredoxin
MAEVVEIDRNGECPECGADWDGGSIFNVWREMDVYKDLSDEELFEKMKECYSHPYRFSRLIGVEYAYNHPARCDGVSEYRCPDCGARWGRFSSVKLEKNQFDTIQSGVVTICAPNSATEVDDPEPWEITGFGD